jgi:hypothetical protein
MVSRRSTDAQCMVMSRYYRNDRFMYGSDRGGGHPMNGRSGHETAVFQGLDRKSDLAGLF